MTCSEPAVAEVTCLWEGQPIVSDECRTLRPLGECGSVECTIQRIAWRVIERIESSAEAWMKDDASLSSEDVPEWQSLSEALEDVDGLAVEAGYDPPSKWW